MPYSGTKVLKESVISEGEISAFWIREIENSLIRDMLKVGAVMENLLSVQVVFQWEYKEFKR